MNHIINVGGGGIFSKYMLCVQNLANINFEKVYLNTIDNRTNNDIFNSVLNQTLTDDLTNIECNHIQGYCNHNKIELSGKFNIYKNVVSKFDFKNDLLDKIKTLQEQLNITEKTIGVHVRLTDMNIHHINDYGCSNFNDYLKCFNEHDDLFVASDNKESLNKLIDIFGSKIKYVPNIIRGETEKENTSLLQLTNFKNSVFWEEAFIEMFLLSKCGSLICRASNLTNAAILHSNTIKNIIRV
jgi:hypothetical protein